MRPPPACGRRIVPSIPLSRRSALAHLLDFFRAMHCAERRAFEPQSRLPWGWVTIAFRTTFPQIFHVHADVDQIVDLVPTSHSTFVVLDHVIFFHIELEPRIFVPTLYTVVPDLFPIWSSAFTHRTRFLAFQFSSRPSVDVFRAESLYLSELTS